MQLHNDCMSTFVCMMSQSARIVCALTNVLCTSSMLYVFTQLVAICRQTVVNESVAAKGFDLAVRAANKALRAFASTLVVSILAVI